MDLAVIDRQPLDLALVSLFDVSPGDADPEVSPRENRKNKREIICC